MEKLTVIAPREDADRLMRRLMRLRAVSLTQELLPRDADGSLEKDAAAPDTPADSADAARGDVPTETAGKAPANGEATAGGASAGGEAAAADTAKSNAASPSLGQYADGGAVGEAAARVARIEAVLPVLTKRSRRKKRLFAPAAAVSLDAFRKNGRMERATLVVEETEKILAELSEVKSGIESAEAKMLAYEPYFAHPYPLSQTGTARCSLVLGALPAGVPAAAAEEAVGSLDTKLEILADDPASGVTLSVICFREEEERVLRALSGVGFTRASFPDASDDTAHNLYYRARRARATACRTVERLEARLDALAENLTDVETLYDIEKTTQLAEENKRALRTTRTCVLLTGWCPAGAHDRVARTLDRFDAAYDFAPPAEGEDVPILLENNGFARNFEWVLGMYSYPRYGKFDPTFLMSIFYFLIFGLMFADAGYGLLLTVVCFGAVALLKPREGMKRFLLMFGYCGISCIVCGVLFGSYFGNFPLAFMENTLGIPPERLPNLSLLPSTEPNLALLFDPLQNPMGFLILSLGVGAVHLVAGMAVKAVLLCREGKWMDAFSDIVAYWLLFGGIGLLFLSRTAGIVLTAVGVASIVLTHGRANKNPLMKFLGGLLGLYDLIGYASDLLSYSRILALGLAAGVIGQVVNMLATLPGNPVVVALRMIVIFTVGHLLNLAINVLGTFVHTARLQYIEFFGKFYEDGGTPFRPITPSDRYTTDLSPEESDTAVSDKTPDAGN